MEINFEIVRQDNVNGHRKRKGETKFCTFRGGKKKNLYIQTGESSRLSPLFLKKLY
jgi:hypothetical protein